MCASAQWCQGLLDGERGHPSQKVERASSLVICACRCEEERGGEEWVLLAQNWCLYLSLCCIGSDRRNHHRKLVKWSPTHLKPYPIKAPATETHPPEAPPPETHHPETLALRMAAVPERSPWTCHRCRSSLQHVAGCP